MEIDETGGQTFRLVTEVVVSGSEALGHFSNPGELQVLSFSSVGTRTLAFFLKSCYYLRLLVFSPSLALG